MISFIVKSVLVIVVCGVSIHLTAHASDTWALGWATGVVTALILVWPTEPKRMRDTAEKPLPTYRGDYSNYRCPRCGARGTTFTRCADGGCPDGR